MIEVIRHDNRTGLTLRKEVRRPAGEEQMVYSLHIVPSRPLPEHLRPVDPGSLVENLRAFDAINAVLLESVS